MLRSALHRTLLGAVSRRLTALSDALVYGLYGLTEDEIRIMDGEPAQMTTETWGASRIASDEAP